MKEGIPKDILEELKLKETREKLKDKGRAILEPHQLSIKIPARLIPELGLKTDTKKSFECEITIEEPRKITVKIND